MEAYKALKFLAVSFYFFLGNSQLIPEIVSDESFDSVSANASKIANGRPNGRRENLDFLNLAIKFGNQTKTCGGSLVSFQWVLTSATCLYE